MTTNPSIYLLASNVTKGAAELHVHTQTYTQNAIKTTMFFSTSEKHKNPSKHCMV